MKIRVGSRESALAVVQANMLIAHLEGQGIETELVTMKTTGDIILDKTLDKIGGKGLFVKELDKALLDGTVDLTVHSFKDIPMQVDIRLPIVAVSAREDPRDALILSQGVAELDLSTPIGCSSARRTLQLKNIFPGVIIAPLRGNVITRLNKLDGGEFGAIVLAVAGLKRLGLLNRISRAFETHAMIPAACQGILAVQARQGFDIGVLEGFHCADAWDASRAERSFVTELDGGCSSPIAAYAEIDGENLKLTGLYVDDAGIERAGSIVYARDKAEEAGRNLALQLKGEAL
ncbi:MAG: hydroxymethylbilane synthase [Oscillospiraceae bacterium]|nr:hydroxymethylbilane synthase [Oscillospiraceae bacterium]